MRSADKCCLTERDQILAVAEQRREHFLGALLAERIETQLCVISFVAPTVRVLRTVVHQQQNLGGTDRIGKQVQ
jgi:hypothetical protein